MASPAGSPPLTSLSLPKKRPPLALPQSQPNKRRKPSIASASSHPLRQTSFPPPDGTGSSTAFSPGSFISDVSDEDLASVSAAAAPSSITGSHTTGGGRGSGRGRGRGRGRPRGRPGRTRADTLSVASGETGGRRASTAGAVQEDANGNNEDDEEEDEDVADLLDASGKIGRERLEEEKERRAMFLSALSALSGPSAFSAAGTKGNAAKIQAMARINAGRYELWNRIHLKKDVVRRLTNQTLSQSVPGTVVTAISAYTKVFAGEIVDRALRVQMEWTAARLAAESGGEADGQGHVKVEEHDLGPLLPDHIREALRRYKADREGGVVGFTGMSLEGRENTAVRNGGRRLFR